MNGHGQTIITIDQDPSFNHMPSWLTTKLVWTRKHPEEDSMKTISRKLYVTNLLTAFLRWHYFACLNPFYLKYTTVSRIGLSSNVFISKSSWFHKAICFLFAVFTCLWILRYSRELLPKNVKDLSQHLNMMNHFMSQIYRVVTLKVIWFNADAICRIPNIILESKIPVWSAKWLNTRLIAYGMSLIYAFYGIISSNWIEGYGGSESYLSAFWKNMVKQGRHNFFLTDEMEANTEFSYYNVIIGLSAAIGLFYYRLLFIYRDGLLLMIALTFWITASGFSNSLQRQDGHEDKEAKLADGVRIKHEDYCQWTTIEDMFFALMKLTTAINDVFGTMLVLSWIYPILDFGFVIEYFVTGGHSGVDWRRLSDVLHFAHSLCVMVIMANASHQIGDLKNWLFDRLKERDAPLEKIYMMIDAVNTNAISIKGLGVFPMTYHTIASILAASLTYYFISANFDPSP